MTRLLRRRHDERGITIVELMITLFLLGLVLATVYQGIFSANDMVASTDDRLRNLEEARALMNVTTKDVRTAVRLSASGSPFTKAEGLEAIFYANLNTTDKPKKVRISIDAQSRLIEEVWTADAASTAPNYTYTTPPKVRYVGRYVANTAAKPIFEYLDGSNNTLAAPVSAANLPKIRAVRITLMVKRTPAYNSPATTLVNRVRLPNVDYNAVAGQ
jgi:hypothetical protein